MEFNYSHIPRYKLGLHIAQILFAFTAWCLGIAVFRAEGAAVAGGNGWTFGVVCLLLPREIKSIC